MLALLAESDLPNCTTLLVGGEACPLALALRWAQGRRLINAYGPTECAVITTLGVVPPDATILSLGDPIANVDLCVLDEQRRPVRRGTAGELWIGGLGVAQGYLRRPELTEQRFLQLEDGDGRRVPMYRSGDRVRMHADGTLEFLGRLDRQVKLRGLRIELGEIEAALRALPGVRGAAVLVREQHEGAHNLVGYVAHEAGAAIEPELRARLSSVLPGYMVPAELIVAPSLPTTLRGKLDTAALERSVALSPAVDVPTKSSRERALLTTYRDVLGRPTLMGVLMSERSRWLLCSHAGLAPARLRLVCLPFAGGGASLYRSWVALAPAVLELCRVQMPGRETRAREPLCRTMTQVLDALVPELLSGPPVAIFGHSLGGLIAFELAAELHRQGCTPLHLFVAGARPPHVPDPYQLHGLREPAFSRAIRERGGVSEEILAHAELRELIMPLLRADLELAERHLRAEPLALPLPITLLAAPADTVIPWNVTQEWSGYTSARFERCTFAGSHFFVREDPARVWRCVEERLETLSRVSPEEHVAARGSR